MIGGMYFMAHLKDLIVTGVSRFLGTVYAKLFKGDLEGTATKAMNDSAGNKITSTYIKDISGGGVNSLNITKGDGTSSNVTMSMEPRVVNLGDQETSTRSCVTSFGQGITIYACSNWTDKPAGAPDAQGTLITVAYNNTSNEMGTRWVWAHQYFMSPFVTYPWVRMGSSEVLTEWTPINRADIPSSNPNLLINPDFKINQRCFVSGNTIANTEYSLDRWRIGYSNLNFLKSINITSSGIELVTANGAGNGYYADFHQLFENPLPSGYYTMSGKIDGVIRTFTGYLGENADSVLFDGVFVLYHTSFAIRFYDDTRKIEWVKLEIGQVATQFVPPDPATELLKCQRYYFALNGPNEKVDNAIMGIACNANWLPLGYIFKTEMHRTPDITITYIGQWDCVDINQSAIAVPSTYSKNGLVNLFSSNGYFKTGYVYYVRFIADAEI